MLAAAAKDKAIKGPDQTWMNMLNQNVHHQNSGYLQASAPLGAMTYSALSLTGK
jgi:hypothetical protein